MGGGSRINSFRSGAIKLVLSRGKAALPPLQPSSQIVYVPCYITQHRVRVRKRAVSSVSRFPPHGPASQVLLTLMLPKSCPVFLHVGQKAVAKHKLRNREKPQSIGELRRLPRIGTILCLTGLIFELLRCSSTLSFISMLRTCRFAPIRLVNFGDCVSWLVRIAEACHQRRCPNFPSPGSQPCTVLQN